MASSAWRSAISQVIAAASNYADHVAEMHGVQERTLGAVEPWMMNFDIFLKAPSSIAGPGEDIVLPKDVVVAPVGGVGPDDLLEWRKAGMKPSPLSPKNFRPNFHDLLLARRFDWPAGPGGWRRPWSPGAGRRPRP